MTCSKSHWISFTIYDSSMLTRKTSNLNDGASAHLTENSTVTQHSCTLAAVRDKEESCDRKPVTSVQRWLEPVWEHKRGTTTTTIKLLSVRPFLILSCSQSGILLFLYFWNDQSWSITKYQLKQTNHLWNLNCNILTEKVAVWLKVMSKHQHVTCLNKRLK